ncbi:MAG TPA: radical SAM protein, partial [Flavobacterium sp.]|nr:radical SAM protein [Flavobacterium sp.]
KGVTVEQVAQVTQNFTENSIMVHAYLMYGYPTQTIQETVDSLEMVRQMFEMGILKSGFWHQFAMTAHSPVGLFPEEFGVTPIQNEITFAHNDVVFEDKTGINHDKFSYGLKKSLFNYMHGICFDYPLQDWFDFKIPRTKVSPNFIYDALHKTEVLHTKPTARVIWMGNLPSYETVVKSKRGIRYTMMQLLFHDKKYTTKILLENEKGIWLIKTLEKIAIKNSVLSFVTFLQLKADYETHFDDFELFWYSKPIQTLREIDLLIL